jgi:hypothetical protein
VGGDQAAAEAVDEEQVAGSVRYLGGARLGQVKSEVELVELDAERLEARQQRRVVDAERARWLALSTPTGFSSFVLAASDPAESEELPPAGRDSNLARLEAAAEERGIELLAPPGTMP